VALFSVVDAVNLSFAFALRGAGDTRFVTVLTFALAWPLMVIPTYLVVRYGGSVYTAWIFITAHIFAMSVCFWLRFRTGKWKAMRVIEPENKDDLTTRAPDALTPRPPLPAGEGE
jgi:MATE family multidrug resistance protein